ncbi:MAG TPA: group 1 truncated hemoglobin [Jatrophihabitans sp.]|jgi:hemoglobin
MTIFDAVGGADAVQEAVAQFYGRLLEDPEVSSFFEDVDMVTLQRHMRAFMKALTGGPDEYAGRGMTAAHAALGISDTDFDAFLAHLVDTLIALGAPDDTISRIGNLITPLRTQVVSSRPGHQQQPRTAVKRQRADNPA